MVKRHTILNCPQIDTHRKKYIVRGHSLSSERTLGKVPLMDVGQMCLLTASSVQYHAVTLPT
jgi:hypothetical protein